MYKRQAYYKFYAFLRPERLKDGWSRDRIIETARELGVPCQSGSCPEIYLERAFTDAAMGPSNRLPVARRLGETSLLLPVDPSLSAVDCVYMGNILRTVIEQGAR